MFTGIVEGVGEVTAAEPAGAGRRLVVAPGTVDIADLNAGDSILVNGACLTTVTAGGEGRLRFDLSAETLECTTLGGLAGGDRVNLEKALLPTTRLGGHLVSGHVDGVGQVLQRRPEGEYERLRIRVPAALGKYFAGKGSVCLDGVSLTVNGVSGDEVDLMLIPHTLQVTNLARLKAGDRVNVEVDLVARYLERLLQAQGPDCAGGPGGIGDPRSTGQ
ncbi:MAG TPA: riboflavin synthase [Gammaproteobacteria bacterium]|nr:riboflavin synthase [Gammaproteobacteria bacterium]